MDITLISRLRDLDVFSLDDGAMEQELQKFLTFTEQGTPQRLATKGQSTNAKSFMHAGTGETFDGRGSHDFQPMPPDLPVTDASFGFCIVCAEFELRNAVRLGNTRNAFVSSDGSCQIMAQLPDVIIAKDRRGCKSCMALYIGISRLYETSGLNMSQVDNCIDYSDDDIGAAIIFKKDNVLILYLSRRSSQKAVEALGLSFFALPMLEFYSQPGMSTCSLSLACFHMVWQ
jgi:hypothetical protein